MNTEKNANRSTAEFKARAVELAVERDQPFSKTAEALGLNKHTRHTWTGK